MPDGVRQMDAGVQGSIFKRLLLIQACWNFDRMQSLGLAYGLEPWFKSSGLEDREQKKALARHAGEYFNTQPYMASFVAGMVCRLEDERGHIPEAERPARIKRLSALKAAAASALAAVGDALFWGALRPFSAAAALICGFIFWRRGAPYFGIGMAGCYLALYNVPVLWVRWRGIDMGYRWGERLPFELKEYPWQAWILRLRWAGFALAAALLILALAAANHKAAQAAALAAYALVLKKWPAAWPSLYGATCGLGFLAALAGWA